MYVCTMYETKQVIAIMNKKYKKQTHTRPIRKTTTKV